MGNSTFPILPGKTWNITKSPYFNTEVQTAVDLTERRISFSATPVYHFAFPIDIMRDRTMQGGVTYDELRTMLGFYLQRRGRWDSFLYTDPDDCQATAEVFSTGDGSTDTFFLTRTLGGFTERVSNPNVVSVVTVANTPTSNYVVNANGSLTFDTPPADDAPLAWTGTYYFRSRFSNDNLDLNQFMSRLWNLRMLEFDGSLGSKI